MTYSKQRERFVKKFKNRHISASDVSYYIIVGWTGWILYE